MSKIKAPKKDAMLGHFLDKNWHTPTINGGIESSVGDRSGEAFKGRKYEGNGLGYVDLSTITGVVTAKASWVKDDLNEINENSLTYEEYSVGVEPVIDIVINGSKHFILDNGYSYHGIAVYENGVLYDFLTCEEGGELNSIGAITGDKYPIMDILAVDFHKEDNEVPFSYLNYFGYNVTTIEVPFSITNTNNDAFGNPLINKGVVRQKLQLKESNCLEGDGVWNFDYGVNVTSLKVSGIEVIGDCTIIGSIVVPNSGLKLYDLVINNSLHYPCAEGDVLFIQDSSRDNQISINDGVVNDVWGVQDVYHYNAYEGGFETEIDINDWHLLGETDFNGSTGYFGVLGVNFEGIITKEDVAIDWFESGWVTSIGEFKRANSKGVVGTKNIYIKSSNYSGCFAINYDNFGMNYVDLSPFVNTINQYIRFGSPTLSDVIFPVISTDEVRFFNSSFSLLPLSMSNLLGLKELNLVKLNLISLDLTTSEYIGLKELTLQEVDLQSNVIMPTSDLTFLSLKRSDVGITPTISQFTNLQELDLTESDYGDIDFSSNTNLLILMMESTTNVPNSFDVSMLSNLIRLDLRESNAFNVINMSNLSNLIYCDIRRFNGTSVDLTGCTSLDYLDVRSTIFTTNLNVQDCVKLRDIVISNGVSENFLQNLLLDLDTYNTYSGAGATLRGNTALTIVVNATLNTPNDVLDAFNSLAARGWNLQMPTPV